MRFLQLVTAPQRRGAEVFALDLARALEERGVSTAIIYLYAAEDGPDLPLRPGDVALAGRKDHPLEHLPGFHPRLLVRLLREVRRFGPNVVQTSGSRTVKYGALVRRLSPAPPWRLVYRAIGDPRVWRRPGPRSTLYEAAVLRPFDAFVAVSGQALAGLKTAGQPAVHIPRGIALERFRPLHSRQEVRRRLGTAPTAPVLVAVGRLSREKRPDRLLRVARAVAERMPDVELWVVGDGPERPKVEAAAGSPHLRVRILGIRDDVADLLAAADLLLLTSDTEGIPGVVLEAAAMELPAVATRVGGVAECITDGETGLLVDPGEEERMARVAAELLADPERRRALGIAARRRAVAEFSLNHVAERYLDFHRSLLPPPDPS